MGNGAMAKGPKLPRPSSTLPLQTSAPDAPSHLGCVKLQLVSPGSRLDEARAAVQATLTLDPIFTIRRLRASAWGDNPTYLAQRERVYDGLRKAGLPEE